VLRPAHWPLSDAERVGHGASSLSHRLSTTPFPTYWEIEVKTAIRRAAIAMVLVSVATVSAASTLEAPEQRTVKFGDLNLATDSGVAQLYARLRSAAREVCEPVDVWNLTALLASKDCADRAVEQAVDDINVPLLKTYHRTQAHVATVAQR
jgi:UrcA family protein